MHLIKLLILSFLIIITACSGKSLPELKDFDKAVWVTDKFACKNERIQFKESLQSQFLALKGLNESAIMNLLGKPDQNELMQRNQKHFSWFISPAPSCKVGPEITTQRLVIRFNATGFAQEIGFE